MKGKGRLRDSKERGERRWGEKWKRPQQTKKDEDGGEIICTELTEKP